MRALLGRSSWARAHGARWVDRVMGFAIKSEKAGSGNAHAASIAGSQVQTRLRTKIVRNRSPTRQLKRRGKRSRKFCKRPLQRVKGDHALWRPLSTATFAVVSERCTTNVVALIAFSVSTGRTVQMSDDEAPWSTGDTVSAKALEFADAVKRSHRVGRCCSCR